jgi:hypothetical protein
MVGDHEVPPGQRRLDVDLGTRRGVAGRKRGSHANGAVELLNEVTTSKITGEEERYSRTDLVDFEANVQGWMNDPASTPFTRVATSTAQRFAGSLSLAGSITATGAAFYTLLVSPPNPLVPAGTTVTYRVFIPTGAMIDYVTPFVQESAPAYTWTGMGLAYTPGIWNMFTVTYPANSAAINLLGVQFHTSAAWTGTVYVDSINW